MSRKDLGDKGEENTLLAPVGLQSTGQQKQVRQDAEMQCEPGLSGSCRRGQAEVAPGLSGESQSWACKSRELRNEWEFAKQIEEVGVGRGKGIPGRGNVRWVGA